MGGKPSAAASAAATKPTASGIDAASVNAMATEPVDASGESVSASGRFGMPHALVIIACIATAAILAPPDMSVRDVLLLIAGAGGIGAVTVVLAVTGGGRGGRIGRFVRAYLSSGN
ncbi:hypothetical protein GCM10023080_085740 [Streptomyces pseudoechinosporeus]